MKTFFRLLLGLLILLLLLFGFQAAELDLFARPEVAEPVPLTTEQKLEDARHFFRLVRESYPFVEAIVHEKGLTNLYDLEEHYLLQIKNSRNDTQFVRLIGEMVQRLEQGTAHCDILPPSPGTTEGERWMNSIVYGVSKKGYYLQDYWWRLLDKGRLYTHAAPTTHYEEGQYLLSASYDQGGESLPRGSAIDRIDGQPVDQYVRSVQDQLWLRFDPYLKKVYSHHSPFLVRGDTSRKAWEVTFLLPSGTEYSTSLPKLPGFQPAPGLSFPEKNVVVSRLDPHTGYVKVGVFLPSWERGGDFELLDSFLSASAPELDRLIIDIRGNLGGAPGYWQEMFVKRLIRHPVEHQQYSIVKKQVFDQLRLRNRLYQWRYRNDIYLGKVEKLDWKDWPAYGLPDYLDPDEYYPLRNTTTFTPDASYQFEGKLFLLVDHDTFSAAEDFAKLCKEKGLATVVGANTIGGAAVSFAPWIFELPNSHLLISMEIDMAFNEDGTINEVYGSRPHHVLSRSTYPTSLPAAYDKENLLADPWIQWVLGQ